MQNDAQKVNHDFDQIVDRINCFYWQTDRDISPEIAGEIFADRHKYFSDDLLLEILAKDLMIDKNNIRIAPRLVSDQTNLGNVNSVRIVSMGGKDWILRAHPPLIPNDYFEVESLVAKKAKQKDLPGYETKIVIQRGTDHPFAYMLIEKLSGVAIKSFLESNPDMSLKISILEGEMMAKLHALDIVDDGFGFFDNTQARQGKLLGIKHNYKDHLLAGLDFNLSYLEKEGMITQKQTNHVKLFFQNSNIDNEFKRSIVHNDFADWNLMTDGEKVTGILDWDECHIGDSVADIACWSTFHGRGERFEKFLEGYISVSPLQSDFVTRYDYYLLRYLISKMTLRMRRLTWDYGHSRSIMIEKIQQGKLEMEELLQKLKLV